MSLILSGSDGLSDIDGSASTPAIRGTDANSGVFFGVNTVSISTDGTAAVTVDSGQRTKFPTTIGVGDATPSTSGSGITFPATASASSDANTLDDYEEGTWTPAFFSDTDNLQITFTSTNALYIKIGRLVYLLCNTVRNQVSVTAGTLYMTGLPFTPVSTPANLISNLAWFDNGGVTIDYFAGSYINSSRMYFTQLTNPAQQQASRYIQTGNLNNTRSIYFSASYMTA
jgi:hypothetical protein